MDLGFSKNARSFSLRVSVRHERSWPTFLFLLRATRSFSPDVRPPVRKGPPLHKWGAHPKLLAKDLNLSRKGYVCVTARTFGVMSAISCQLPFEITFRHPGSGQQPSS